MGSTHRDPVPHELPPGRLAGAREAALIWWSQRAGDDPALCDACNRELWWGEGCLVGAEEAGRAWRAEGRADWLLCVACARQCLDRAV